MADRRPDAELLDRLQAGDDGALAEVYRHSSPLVYGLCHRVTADPAASAELCQQVFVELWRQPRRFRRDTSLDTALTVRAHQLAVKWCRQRSASPPGDGPAEEPARSSPSLRSAMEALPPEQQRAITMAYFGGRTYREVATALSISDGAAKTQLRLALSQLTFHLPTEGMTAWT